MVIKGYDVGVVLKKTWKEINEDKVPMYAGMMAYNFFFALFPMLLFFAALLSLIAKPSDVAGWMHGIANALPPAVAALLATTLEKVVFSKGAPGLLSFGLLTAAWSGSVVFGAFRQGLNEAYDVEETRPWWKQQVMQLGALAITGVTLVVATVILVKGETVVAWLAAHVGMGAIGTLVWQVAQYPLAIGVVVVVLWLQYYYLPDCRHQDKSDVVTGAVVATVLWILATLLFRIYVQNFHAMNPAYGVIGAIMVLLTWMYISSFVLLAAGELNSELQAGTGRADGKSRKPGKRTSAEHRRTKASVRAATVGAERAASERAQSATSYPPITAADHLLPAPMTAREWRGFGAAMTELAHEGARLVKREITLARVEIATMLRAATTGTALTAVGVVLGLLGALSLITSIALLAGDQWMKDRYWMGGLGLMIIAAVVAFGLAKRGISEVGKGNGRRAQAGP